MFKNIQIKQKIIYISDYAIKGLYLSFNLVARFLVKDK